MSTRFLAVVAVGFLIAGCGGDGQPFGGEASQNGRGDSGAVGGSVVASTGGKTGTGGAAGMTGAGGRNTFCDDNPCAQIQIDYGPGFKCSCATNSGPSRGSCECAIVPPGTGGAGGKATPATGTGGTVAADGGSTGSGGSGSGGAAANYPACTQPAGFGYSACTKFVSKTSTLTGFTKDGRVCLQCDPFTAGQAECLVTGTGGGVCVHSCGECQFNCVAPGCLP